MRLKSLKYVIQKKKQKIQKKLIDKLDLYSRKGKEKK